jgi:hypothetical protein
MQVAVAVAGTIILLLEEQQDQEVEEQEALIQELMGNQEHQIEVEEQELDLTAEDKVVTEVQE